MDMAPMKDFDPALFQQYPNSFPAGPRETSSGAVKDCKFVPTSETLITTVVGSPAISVLCAASGAVLGRCLGHSTDISSLLWVPAKGSLLR